MQIQQHGDLSTMPATNFKSGRVQTMLEEQNPEGQNNNSTDETGEINDMAALLAEICQPYQRQTWGRGRGRDRAYRPGRNPGGYRSQI